MAGTTMTSITYRKLTLADSDAFDAHLRALDNASRRMRFGMTTTDVFLKDYADRCITINAIIHGAFHGDLLVGVAELRPLGEHHFGEAEIAFSVLADWRNMGVGTELFGRTLRSARNRGFERLYMTCLRYNAPMQALARKFSAEIVVELDESVAVVETPRGTIISLLREAFEDASSITIAALDWQRKALARAQGFGTLARSSLARSGLAKSTFAKTRRTRSRITR